jgi:phosphatidylserine synthase
MQTERASGSVVAVIYVGAILFRLVRFRLATPPFREFYGMPSPMVALAASSAVLVEVNWLPASFFSELVALLFAIMAASRLSFPKWGHPCLEWPGKTFWRTLWAVHLLAFFPWPGEAIFSASMIYLVLGPATLNKYHREQRSKNKSGE